LNRTRRVEDLDQPAFDHREVCPQHFVAAHDFTQTALERADVERSGQAVSGEQVVSRGAWIQLIEKPQSLLGKRHRVELETQQRALLWRQFGYTIEKMHRSVSFLLACFVLFVNWLEHDLSALV